jgi:glycosyltransferase involved in cell wall biosynthesis
MLRHAGIGTYIRNIVPRVMQAKPEWRFSLIVGSGADASWPGTGDPEIIRCDANIYTIREQLEVAAQIPRGVDLFWCPHYNIPLLTRAPLAVTVHDVCHLAMPELYGGVLRQVYARTMFTAVRRRAKLVMFDSEFTRQEFNRLVGEPTHSDIVHLGVGDEWFTATPGAPLHERPYFLFVGSTKPHKNLGRLLDALEQIVDHLPHDLLIVGNEAKQRMIDEAALAQAERLKHRVHLVQGPDDSTLKRYMAQATALVLPSLYEGFGLPALEAMATGTPAIVARAASLPEVCEDAAEYCDPCDPTDIARAMRAVAEDPALSARLRAGGLSRARELSWDVAAARASALLARAAGDD